MEIRRYGNQVGSDVTCRGPIFQRPLRVEATLRPGDDRHVAVGRNGRDVVDCICDVFLKGAKSADVTEYFSEQGKTRTALTWASSSM